MQIKIYNKARFLIHFLITTLNKYYLNVVESSLNNQVNMCMLYNNRRKYN